MTEPPIGTVTLLFTDIEGSTRLLQALGERYAAALDEHRELLRAAFTAHGGYEVSTGGDSFLIAFHRASDALLAAAEAQQALAAHRWPEEREIRVRIGIHTGEPRLVAEDYVGLDVHRAARVMAAGHGGQVLLSKTTRDLLDESVALRDLGEHRLKDLREPQRLYQLLIAGLPNDFSPLKTLENRPTNLPVQPTALIGREQEVQEVIALLRREEVRLVTLVGPGGTGKTRIALQVAAELVDEFNQGVFFVSLAGINDPELVVPSVAQTLGIREQTTEPLVETLAEYLRARELLLLLDNFEQLIAGAPVLASLLAAAHGPKILVTTQARLHLSGERVYEVPPLALPDPRNLPDAEVLSHFHSVALFIERAQATRSDFQVTNENAPAVAEICIHLEGLPLAIELAAARISILPPHALLNRLDRRLKLLTGGASDSAERHRTLRRTIEWSHELLDRPEQVLFACLGVFVGGTTLEAAEAVCPSDELGLDLIDGLASLVDKSLLRQENSSADEPRFRMLETLREYAVEELERWDSQHRLPRRHAEHFVELAERGAPELRRADSDRHWIALLEAERDNLRSALQWLIGEGEGELAQRLVCGLFSFWHDRGPAREACESAAQALALPSSPSTRARTLSHGSLLAIYIADRELMQTWAEEGLALARQTKDELSRMCALLTLGVLAFGSHRREEGLALLEEALEAARAADDEWAIGVTIVTLLSHDAIDDPARASALAEETASLQSVSASTRALIEFCRGFIAEKNGDQERAMSLYRESLAIAREIGFDRTPALLLNLGWLALRQGDLVEARAQLSAAVTSATESGARGYVAGAIAYLTVLAATEGDLMRAATLRGALESYRETIGEVPITEFGDGSFDQYLERARALAGHERWAEAFDRGHAMPLSEAASLAVGDNPLAGI